MDLTGQKYGRLTVVELLPRAPTQAYYAKRYHCTCECGATIETFANALRSGRTLSCGCLRRERASVNIKKARAAAPVAPNLKHGLSGTPEWATWADMRKRCREHSGYAGRGIVVDPRWEVFENFIADMGRRPSPDHSIDRIDNDGNYEPGNCRWATRKEQARNRRSNALLTHVGRTQTIAAWAENTGVKPNTIWMRVHVLGWSVGLALTK